MFMSFRLLGMRSLSKWLINPFLGSPLNGKTGQKPLQMNLASKLTKIEPLILLFCSSDFLLCPKPENSAHSPQPQLAQAVAELSSKESSKTILDFIPTEQYVLDGGSLIHPLPWKRCDSYGAIAQSYADFYHKALW